MRQHHLRPLMVVSCTFDKIDLSLHDILFKIKYDLLTSNIRGQMIFSHTILRFSVEDAVLPLTLLSFALASIEGFVLIFSV